MNYIKQLNAFWHWRSLHKMTHAQADLYMALLSVANENYWKSNLPIPGKKLIDRADLCDKSQLRKLRNDLISLGLIVYKEGRSRQPGLYNIVKLYSSGDIYTPDNDYSESVKGTDWGTNYVDFNPNNDTIKDTPYKTYKHINKTENFFCENSYEEVYNSYALLCPSLPQTKNLTDRRRGFIKDRLQTFTVTQIKTAFQKAEQSSMMRGEVGDWNGASFDWIMKSDEHIDNLLEGKYDDGFTNIDYRGKTQNIKEIERMFEQQYN